MVNKNDVDVYSEQPTSLEPPPRWLMGLILGGVLALVIGIVGGFIAFREVLLPSQQQRVIALVPFMENFLPNRSADAYLPTSAPNPNLVVAPEDLLDLTIVSTPLLPTETIPPTSTATSAHTATFAPSATALPSMTPVVPTSIPIVPTPSAASAVTLPPDAHLYGFQPVIQTWNNCGPATITMSLSYYAWGEDQEYAASFLRPDGEDKNVTPREMVRFVNEQTGVRAITRMGGTLELLKAFLANGFPVIVSIGYAPEGEDWLGHYRAIVGYSDLRQVFFAYDSYLGTGENADGITMPYDEMTEVWQHFNRNFIVLYESARESEVAEILGERSDTNRAAELALETAQQEARSDPRNGFAWFNMGTALVALGRYEDAAVAYDRARQLNLPFRMLWYQFGPYEAYFNVGRYDDVLALVTANLNNGGEYVEETHYWQGQAYLALGRNTEAAEAFRRAVAGNQFYDTAQEALAALG